MCSSQEQFPDISPPRYYILVYDREFIVSPLPSIIYQVLLNLVTYKYLHFLDPSLFAGALRVLWYPHKIIHEYQSCYPTGATGHRRIFKTQSYTYGTIASGEIFLNEEVRWMTTVVGECISIFFVCGTSDVIRSSIWENAGFRLFQDLQSFSEYWYAM